MTIRPYHSEDRDILLGIFHKLTPESFHPSEEKQFQEYLDFGIEDYYVILEKGQIIGAGGINYFPEEKSARISWDMVHPEFQGKGFGSFLIQHRLNVINSSNQEIKRIIVRSWQGGYVFYGKHGFQLEYVKKDYWAKGFDLYFMQMEVSGAH